MAEKNYALIKNGDVINIAVFDDSNSDLINDFINVYDIDDIVIATDKAAINGTYDGTKFWLPKPYPSWIKNEETNEWEAPTPYPTDGKYYIWVENDLNWQVFESPV